MRETRLGVIELWQGDVTMWQYYAFMALLIATLVLWAIIALRDDGYEEKSSGAAPAEKTEENPS